MTGGLGGPAAREAFFLEAGRHRLFALHYPPGNVGGGRCIVVVPPFAEEMNRSRRTIHLLARSAQAAGSGLVVVDLHGTGDSSGEFRDARWEGWREDLAATANWVAGAGYAGADWVAIRTGALLLLDGPPLVDAERDRVLLWHPVVSGAQYLAQFVRLRLAANMIGGEGAKESSADLMAAFERDETIEIAGYGVAGPLASSLKEKDLRRCDVPRKVVAWLDLAARADAKPAAATSQTLDRWRGAGERVDWAGVQGPQFWAIQETTVAPALVDETVRRLASAGAAH